MKGKVALVTGGTSGIGRATAVALAKAGASVVVAGRREAEGQETVRLVQKAGGKGGFFRADVSKEGDIRALIDHTVKAFGRLDIAVNNAGIEHTQPVVEATPEDYRRIFDVNVLGTLLSMKHEIPAMLKGGGGSIVNTSSIAGTVGFPGIAIYGGTKAAINQMTRVAAMEVAKQGVRINAVSPAAIETEMFDRFAGSEEQKKALRAMHPVGRAGRAEEVAAAIVFLCSDEASFITGQDLKVDGGFTVP
jgi:NAD(P)-dependent dehydrogenase (short-subunit alcohol dehydrogenase family)